MHTSRLFAPTLTNRHFYEETVLRLMSAGNHCVKKEEKMIPKERARPLDQADSGTCSLHAVANATVEKLMDSNIDVKLDEIVGGFKQLDFIDVVEGNDVMEFDQAVIRRMTDKNTKKLYDVTLRITVCRVKKDLLKKIQSKEVKCVKCGATSQNTCLFTF